MTSLKDQPNAKPVSEAARRLDVIGAPIATGHAEELQIAVRARRQAFCVLDGVPLGASLPIGASVQGDRDPDDREKCAESHGFSFVVESRSITWATSPEP
jgi:hypothetical protein